MSEKRKQIDAVIGAAATFISEKSKEAAEFFNDKKDVAKDFLSEQTGKATEYINEKKEIYQTKTALDAAKTKVDALFGEIGRVSFYGKAVVPERTRPVIKKELVDALEEVDALQKKYDALYADDEDDDCKCGCCCDCDDDCDDCDGCDGCDEE